MDREFNDQIVAQWAAACDALRQAGGPVLPIRTVDFSVIRFAYEQQRTERTAALALLDQWAEAGLIPPDAVLRMRHALGVIREEQLNWELAQLGGES